MNEEPRDEAPSIEDELLAHENTPPSPWPLWAKGLLVGGGCLMLAVPLGIFGAAVLPSITDTLAHAEQYTCAANLYSLYAATVQGEVTEPEGANRPVADRLRAAGIEPPIELDAYETLPWPEEHGVIARCRGEHAGAIGEPHELWSDGTVTGPPNFLAPAENPTDEHRPALDSQRTKR